MPSDRGWGKGGGSSTLEREGLPGGKPQAGDRFSKGADMTQGPLLLSKSWGN